MKCYHLYTLVFGSDQASKQPIQQNWWGMCHMVVWKYTFRGKRCQIVLNLSALERLTNRCKIIPQDSLRSTQNRIYKSPCTSILLKLHKLTRYMIPLCACLPFKSLNTERHQTSPEFVQMCQARLDVDAPKSSKITLFRQKFLFQQTTKSKLAIFHPPKTWVVFEESCPPFFKR